MVDRLYSVHYIGASEQFGTQIWRKLSQTMPFISMEVNKMFFSRVLGKHQENYDWLKTSNEGAQSASRVTKSKISTINVLTIYLFRAKTSQYTKYLGWPLMEKDGYLEGLVITYTSRG